jgi:RHS repeat-associated protein
MRNICLAALVFFSFPSVVCAQGATPNVVTPSTMTGIEAFTPYDGVRENIALVNGNLNLNVPLFKLPQRAGRTWELGLNYDSKLWEIFLQPAGQDTLSVFWLPDIRLPLIAPNLRLSVPTLQATSNLVASGPCLGGGTCNDYCVNQWIFTSADGGKHLLANKEDCQGNFPNSAMNPIHIAEASDASFMRLNTTNHSDIVMYLKDGTQVHFYSYNFGIQAVFDKIIDPNGNVTTATGTGHNSDGTSAGVYIFSDSVGRVITADLNAHTIAYKDATGVSQTITFTNANINTGGPITFTHPNGECWVPGNSGVAVLSASETVGPSDSEWTMTIPDGALGLTYRFHYDAVGELTKITYPSGGYTKYDFTPYQIVWNQPGLYCSHMDFREVIAKHECRSASGSCATEDTTTYTPTISTNPNLATGNLYMDVRTPDPSGIPNRAHYTFTTPLSGYYVAREISRSIYSGESTLVRTIQTDYSGSPPVDNSLPIRVTTTLADVSPNQVSKVETDYDSVTGLGLIDDPIEIREFGFDGAVRRRTHSTWLRAEPYAIDQEHILDRPLTQVVYDSTSNTCQGQGSPCAETTYEYDSYTEGLSSSGATQHQSMPTARGNITAINRWLNTANSFLTTRYQYDDGGNVRKVTDPRGNNSATYDFTDNFAQASCAPASNGLTGSAAAYARTITNALNQVTTFSYNSCPGNLATLKDPNNQTTSYFYDTLGRQTSISYPDGGLTSWTYNDVAPVSMTKTQKQDASTNITAVEIHDGLSRLTRTQLSDPSGTDYVDITYDVAGRKASMSNPYRSTSDPTYGITSYQYDSLNRPTVLTRQDGGTILTSYAGAATEVQDEGNGASRVTRISQLDAQGRLSSLCELTSITQQGSGGTPSACNQAIPGTGFLTTYAFDALNDLTTVTQGSETRSFLYDSLSRLTSASNPESGTATYSYDGNGNLTAKTDARGITINYSPGASPIDALNRVTQKTYSDGTPTANFVYDTQPGWGITLTNVVGRLTEIYTGSLSGTQAASIFGYDPMGRVIVNDQCTPSNCGTTAWPMRYTYNLIGHPLSATNGKGTTFSYTYDSVGRLAGITSNLVDATHPTTLLSSSLYTPLGTLASATLGPSGPNLSRSYNPRTLLTSATNGSVYSLSLTYTPNADVFTAIDSANGNWTYGYDDFNRLKSASATGQSYTYDYDRYSNRWHQVGPHPVTQSYTGNNNRMDGYSYDAAGNLLNDGTYNYSYDAENRIKQVNAGAIASYTYDANGRRVRKSTTGGSSDYAFDLAGHAITEVNAATGGWTRGEVYAGGQHLATYANNTTYFIHADWLGTERVRTNYAGSTPESCTSLPFGDSLTCSIADVSPLHFTGQERDGESGLDNFGARFNSSNLGRFMSPDAINIHAVRMLDPQRLNLYAYARNNPLIFFDPSGADIVSGTGDQKAIRAALVEIASHPGGREFLTKLDKLTAKITVSTGTNLKDDKTGRPAYGKTTPEGGAGGAGRRPLN